ncbi:phage tail tape measure protein [Clostridium estertheticum]|uniref:Phage tail tape measure protein n=1 Tax=Clostridium estertheticum TaxID=238834 RepID=A0A5N7IQ44_9CLOT|nr:phage tail tape measure protein [Clostridium estertheticum]MPQ32439.1 phage tail tape measure protein [Clostridium estertheticum]MPQ63098.1 phage tail tape measure protein [Clostridium estertheticum]
MGVNVGSAVAYLTLDRSPFRNGLASAGAEMRSFASGGGVQSLGNAMTSVGKGMALGVTAPLVGIGAAASKASMDFEAQMSKVKAISGATGEDFNKLREQAIKLGADTNFSASEAANGMENLASAGFKNTEIMTAMPGMLSLAAAGGVDIATAADIASSSLRGFGLEADKTSHVADVLAKVAGDTNAGITDTGEAMKYIAPVAKSLGVSLEDTSAAIGLLSNAGIKGSQAGTTLRGALTSLAAPTTKSSKEMKKLGMNFFDAHGKMLPLGQVIQQLKDKTKGLTSQQKASTMETLFGKEAMSGMLTLVDQGPQKFNQLSNSLKNCDGASKKMADTMQDNLKGSIEAMKGSLETAAIRIGDVLAPSIKKLAGFIANLTNKFSALPKPVQTFIVKGAVLVAAIGPIMLVFAKLITSTRTVMSVFSGISSAARVFTMLPALLSPPVLIAVGIIAGLGFIVYEVKKHWAGLSAFFTKILGKISSFFKKWGVETLAAFVPVIGIPLLISKHWGSLSKGLSNICNKISHTFKTSIEGWKYGFSELGKFMGKVGAWICDGLLGGLGKGFKKVTDFVGKMANGIKNTFKKILGINSPSVVFDSYGGFIGEGLVGGLDKQAGAITAKFKGLGNKIKGLGNIRPDFSGLNTTALHGPASGGRSGIGNVSNNSTKSTKQLNYSPNIKMYVTVADTGAKGTGQLTNELNGMAKTAMKNSMVEMFMNDAIKSF